MREINKVLLLVPRYEKSRYRPVLQAGIGYLAEALCNNGIDYEYLDMGFSDANRKLPRLLKQFNPDFVGISMLTFRYRDHYKLARYIKDILPDTIIGAGGAHCSLFSSRIVEECPSIDVVFKGEGERALIDLCKKGNPSQIEGLIYSQEGKINDTGEAKVIFDLENIDFPRYRKLPLERYIQKEFNILPIVSSRGCPYKCIYCPVHLSMGYKFRKRSAKSIVNEIEYWYERGYHRFGISDDNFTFNEERVITMCDEIKKRKLSGLKLSCDNGIRADHVDYSLLKAMKEAGFWRIAYGVEAGSDKLLTGINKNLNIATVKKAIKDACDLDYTVRLFFLIGSPNERWRDFIDSVKLAKYYPIFDASFYNVIPYPNTELFNWIKENAHFLDSPENYLHYATGKINKPVFYTKEFTYIQRKRAFYYAKKVSLQITRQALKRKLKPMGLLGNLAARFYEPSLANMLLEWQFSRKFILMLSRRLIDKILEESVPFQSYMPPQIKECYAFSDKPRVSVIIPSLDGWRGGNVAKLIEDFSRQTYKDFEINIIKNTSPQGKAINLGAKKARGEILLIVDDDSRMGNPNVIENLVKVLDKHGHIGMVGASIQVPPDANWLQKRAGKEFPRFGMKVVDRLTESDMACHGCCAIPKRVFEEVGGERENILRGLDPDLRYRMRQKGYKIVLAPKSWVYHPLPATLGGLINTFFRNGMGSAYCLKYQPELIYDTDEVLELKAFQARVPFLLRILRFPVRVIKALFELKFLRVFAYLMYALGFYYGIIKYSLTKKKA